jgi:hypothetical protein
VLHLHLLLKHSDAVLVQAQRDGLLEQLWVDIVQVELAVLVLVFTLAAVFVAQLLLPLALHVLLLHVGQVVGLPVQLTILVKLGTLLVVVLASVLQVDVGGIDRVVVHVDAFDLSLDVAVLVLVVQHVTLVIVPHVAVKLASELDVELLPDDVADLVRVDRHFFWRVIGLFEHHIFVQVVEELLLVVLRDVAVEEVGVAVLGPLGHLAHEIGRALLAVGAFLTVVIALHEVDLADLLQNLKQIDAVIGIAADDLVASDVAHVEIQDLLREKIDQRLDALGHLLRLHARVRLVDELLEVEARVGHLEAADVELVLEEHRVVVDRLLLPEVAPDLIANVENGYDDLLLLEVLLIIVIGDGLVRNFGALVLRGIWNLVHSKI